MLFVRQPFQTEKKKSIQACGASIGARSPLPGDARDAATVGTSAAFLTPMSSRTLTSATYAPVVSGPRERTHNHIRKVEGLPLLIAERFFGRAVLRVDRLRICDGSSQLEDISENKPSVSIGRNCVCSVRWQTFQWKNQSYLISSLKGNKL
ncbi:hypothetical protein CDAR_416791 [Caerostris darwini]|uniref:Uncharacterized protein n=1 Tax=Caerostris darwini TaxID=1538125 RepID=A0AAV4X935_9ARAC|nr:hypothetical protein CDAR_416791 [Caerostris darwini]